MNYRIKRERQISLEMNGLTELTLLSGHKSLTFSWFSGGMVMSSGGGGGKFIS
jgi:hypothetical protein